MFDVQEAGFVPEVKFFKHEDKLVILCYGQNITTQNIIDHLPNMDLRGLSLIYIREIENFHPFDNIFERILNSVKTEVKNDDESTKVAEDKYGNEEIEILTHSRSRL